MQTVNKAQFILWLDGGLLHFENGRGTAVNEKECKAAMEALEMGETIAFKDNFGKIISKGVMVGDTIKEIEA